MVAAPHPSPRLVVLVGLAAAYAITGMLGMQVASPPGNVTSVWLPAGISLAALVRWGPRVWPGITLGSFICNVLVFPEDGLSVTKLAGSLLIAIGSTVGLLTTRWLIERTSGLDALASPGQMLRFLGSAAVGCAINATGGLLTTISLSELPLSAAPNFWFTWWLGDGVGMLALAPIALGEGTPRPRRPWEWVGMLGLLLVSNQLVFGRPVSGLGGTSYPLAWTVLPAAVWAGARLGGAAVCVATVLIHALVTWATVSELGPFGHYPASAALLMIDGLLAVVVITGLFLASAAAQVRAQKALLETRVHERTRELETANRALLGETEERVRLAGRLVEVQKQEALGRLAGGVAHDFNNLLTVVSGEAELICRDPTTPLHAQDSANAILAATQRAAELTRQLLAVARRQPSAPRAVDVGEVLHANRRLLRPLFPESVTLDLDCAMDCTVSIDPTQLDQIILNLALNARDAIVGAGTVRITGARRTLDAAQAQALGLTPGEWVRVEVTDTGEGIPAEVLPRIFEPFFTTKADGRGTGLGLSTVWGIASQARGTVRVTSTVGKGSTFSLWLPFSPRGAEVAGAPPAELISARPSATVLVVEDEPLVRRTVVLTLEREGYRVLTASDGEEALALLRRGDVTFDLVLTDVVMPRLGGVELARAIRAQHDVPVIFMSGFHEQQAELTHETVLGKPFAAGHLLAVVRMKLPSPPGGRGSG
jgi:signal transduction histidine kinase/CheY-like chemotaxis protein